MNMKNKKQNKEAANKQEKSKQLAERLWNEVAKKVRVYVLL
jgi:hypothetical protein